jgi:hypothetical protein
LEEAFEGEVRSKDKKPVYNLSDLKEEENKIKDKLFVDIDP